MKVVDIEHVWTEEAYVFLECPQLKKLDGMYVGHLKFFDGRALEEVCPEQLFDAIVNSMPN